jgi:hypothetical protein
MARKDLGDDFIGTGLNETEKNWGRDRFKEYRISYPHLNAQGNLQLLNELVWKECIQERLKGQIGALSTGGKVETPPKLLQEASDAGLKVIIELKDKLGMFEEQKQTDAFKHFQELEEKVAEYRRKHPHSFAAVCPKCAFDFYMKRRTECYKEFVSPFVDDKIVQNTPLHKLYKAGKITKEECADVLGVSPKDIDWLDKHVYGNVVPTDDAKKIEPAQPPEPPATPTES